MKNLTAMKAMVKDRETGRIFTITDEYATKKQFKSDIDGNGLICKFISTPENFDQDSEKYAEKLERDAERKRENRQIAKKVKENYDRIRKEVQAENEAAAELAKAQQVEGRRARHMFEEVTGHDVFTVTIPETDRQGVAYLKHALMAFASHVYNEVMKRPRISLDAEGRATDVNDYESDFINALSIAVYNVIQDRPHRRRHEQAIKAAWEHVEIELDREAFNPEFTAPEAAQDIEDEINDLQGEPSDFKGWNQLEELAPPIMQKLAKHVEKRGFSQWEITGDDGPDTFDIFVKAGNLKHGTVTLAIHWDEEEPNKVSFEGYNYFEEIENVDGQTVQQVVSRMRKYFNTRY